MQEVGIVQGLQQGGGVISLLYMWVWCGPILVLLHFCNKSFVVVQTCNANVHLLLWQQHAAAGGCHCAFGG